MLIDDEIDFDAQMQRTPPPMMAEENKGITIFGCSEISIVPLPKHPGKYATEVVRGKEETPLSKRPYARYTGCSRSGGDRSSHRKLICLNSDGSTICGCLFENSLPKFHKHSCSFPVRGGIPSMMQNHPMKSITLSRQREVQSVSSSKTEIEKAFLRMVASTKLSFNQASSPAMKTFVQTLIHESQQFPTKPAKDLFDVPNRKTIAKKMIQESDSLLAEFFNHLPTRVCLSVDGGTLGHTGYNIYCATNPLEMNRPLLWTIRAEGKSADIYAASIGAILLEMFEKGITVTSCVTDGFLGLVSGVRMATMHGLKQIAFHWPCMAHRLNNALSKTVAMHTIAVSTFEKVRTVCRSSHTNSALRNPRKIHKPAQIPFIKKS
ncbi:hypothetical protein BLNAU_20794 [Blattamonas nauphoetae]|uniref:DUF659 domain-containing protein n=1 Tax=Blattamonas nauphoetae TaxID=2049346 RepID=A0ABQ9WYA3_9EUKA|nr:hypothetical protein BLNAU_20794 [Blattamonas nauphoetae]